MEKIKQINEKIGIIEKRSETRGDIFYNYAETQINNLINALNSDVTLNEMDWREKNNTVNKVYAMLYKKISEWSNSIIYNG